MYTLQKLLTHKSPLMTQKRYAHLRDDALKRASEQFPAQHLWKRIRSFTRQRLERMAKASFDSSAIHKGRSKGPIKRYEIGANGNLYVAVYGEGCITVLDPNGKVVQRIMTRGRFPTNLAFSPYGVKKIYITEGEFGSMEVHSADTDGLPLYG